MSGTDLVPVLADLEQHEAFIRQNVNTAFEVACRLAEIKGRQLYLAKSATWELYLVDHWPGVFSLRHADKLIKSVQVTHALESGGGGAKTVTVRAAQSLSRLPSDLQIQAHEQAVKTAAAKRADADSNGEVEPTAVEIEEAVREQEAKTKEPIDLIRMSAKDFRELSRQADALQGRIEQLSQSAYGAELAHRTAELRHHVEEIKQALKQGAPHCECPHCGLKQCCESCKGRGWFSWAMFRNAPKAMQETVQDHA